MKTNFIFILIAVFTCSINLHAQKSKTKKIYVKHVRLPLNIIFKDYETYSFDVFIPYDLKIDTSYREKKWRNIAKFDDAKYHKSRVEMDGFSRVNSGEIKITLRMGSVNTGVIQSEYNDNNGFFYSVPIDELSRYEVTDKNGVVIEKGEHLVKSVQNTTSYKDYKTAKANLRDDVAKLKNTTAQKSFYEIKNKIIVAIYPYDFYNQTTVRKVYSIKKHVSEKIFENHMQIAVESFNKWSFKKNGNEILEELEESIKFWEVQNAKIKSSNNSKDLEVFKATSMNLALVFYYGDKIDESLTCLENLLEKMPNFKAAKEMQSDILETKARMELNAIYTTHFDHKG